jgi:hypothetical protein
MFVLGLLLVVKERWKAIHTHINHYQQAQHKQKASHLCEAFAFYTGGVKPLDVIVNFE